MSTKQKTKNVSRSEILEGPITTTIFKLALPIMIGNGMQVLYNLTDTFWLGKLGSNAVAALSVSFPIVFLLISIGGGITVAGTALVSQYTGAGDYEHTNKVAGQVLVFVMSLAVLISIIGVLFNEQILRLIGTPADILPAASSYLDVIMGGVSFMFLFFIFSALLRGYGDTKTPMWLMIGTTLINILLDPFLIFGWWIFPAWGVAGAAAATIFARGVGGILGLFILFTGKKGIQLTLSHLKPDWKYIKRIIKLGVPSAGEMSVQAIGMTVMMTIVTNFGSAVVAAYGIGMRLLSVIMMPSRGFSRATTAMVGQNLGARQSVRAEKSAWVSSGILLVLLTLLGGVFALFAEEIITVFNTDPQVVTAGKELLQIFALSFGFLGVRIVIGGSFRGAGNTVEAMILAVIALFGLRVPLALLFAYSLDLQAIGIWWGMALGSVISATIGSLWFKQGTWKQRSTNN
ncbi:MATE family efflux transporter [Halanaerobaculum tunisiense]